MLESQAVHLHLQALNALLGKGELALSLVKGLLQVVLLLLELLLGFLKVVR